MILFALACLCISFFVGAASLLAFIPALLCMLFSVLRFFVDFVILMACVLKFVIPGLLFCLRAIIRFVSRTAIVEFRNFSRWAAFTIQHEITVHRQRQARRADIRNAANNNNGTLGYGRNGFGINNIRRNEQNGAGIINDLHNGDNGNGNNDNPTLRHRHQNDGQAQTGSETTAHDTVTVRTRLYPTLPAEGATAPVIDDFSDDFVHVGIDRPGPRHAHADRDCVVCFDRERSVAVFPCGHTHMCLECTHDIMTRTQICPLCQQTILEFRQVFV